MDQKEILQLISDSVSLLPDEKYHLMVATKRWKMDEEKITSLKNILIQEKKDIGEKILAYKDNCLNKVMEFEKHKYDNVNTKAMQSKIEKIKKKIQQLKIYTEEIQDKEDAEEIILHI